MALLYFLSYLSILLQVCFATLSIAAGLYYLAEIVEEYTVPARKTINWMIAITIVFYIFLIFFENLPWSMISCGIAAQFLHVAIMSNFPFVEFCSPSFLGALGFLIANHFLAFQYFSANYYPFTEVMAFFTLCLWMVPFALFVSLSANDNVLPTLSEKSPLLSDKHDVVTNYFSTRGKKQGLLTLFNYAKDSLLPQRNKKSF